MIFYFFGVLLFGYYLGSLICNILLDLLFGFALYNALEIVQNRFSEKKIYIGTYVYCV